MRSDSAKQDMNPMGLIGEYTAATASGPIAFTPELFGGLPRAAAIGMSAAAAAAGLSSSHQAQLAFVDDQHQTILDHYGVLANGTMNGMRMAEIASHDGADQRFDDDADSDEDEQIPTSTQVQHFDVGVGSDSLSTHQQYDDDDEDDDNGDGDDDDDDDDMGETIDGDNSDEVTEQCDEEAVEPMNMSNDNDARHRTANQPMAMQSNAVGSSRTFKKKTKSTQTSAKIKPVKRPGLVLKTPIAYQPCLDPSVIPIQRDGMGMFCIVLFFVSFFSFGAGFLFSFLFFFFLVGWFDCFAFFTCFLCLFALAFHH